MGIDFSSLDDAAEPEPAIDLSVAAQEILALRAQWLPMMPAATTIKAKHAGTGLTATFRVNQGSKKATINALEWLALQRYIETGQATPEEFGRWLRKKITTKNEFKVTAHDPPDPKSKLLVSGVMEAYGLTVVAVEVEPDPPQLR